MILTPLVDKEKLRDEYVNDEFYQPDMIVTKYTYDIMKNNVEWENLDSRIGLKFDAERTKLYIGEEQLAWLNEDGSYDVSLYDVIDGKEAEKKEVSFYVIGDEVKNDVTWQFRDMENDEYVDGEAVFVSKEKLTLEELAFMEFDETKGISKTDWYNAFVDFLNEGEWDEGITGWGEYGYQPDFSMLLMRWYEYEITIAPGETIVNTVTAPIYPTIDAECNPPHYEYLYLLSPAKLWSDFGSLEIVINTPYYLVSENKELFEETDTGYVLKCEGLPDEELSFILSETPVSATNSIWFYAVCLILLIIIIVVVAGKVKKRKDKCI